MSTAVDSRSRAGEVSILAYVSPQATKRYWHFSFQPATQRGFLGAIARYLPVDVLEQDALTPHLTSHSDTLGGVHGVL